MKISAVIVAGGKGTRMGYEKNKVLLPICGKEIILYTLKAFSENKYIQDICLVTGEDDLAVCHDLVCAHGFFKVKKIVPGGATRQESVYNGLKNTECDIVCIHDGARALITDELISETVEDAIKFGAAAPGVISRDTLKLITDDGFIDRTIDREKTVLIQTPQVFKKDEIIEFHRRAKEEKISVTDDCALAEKFGLKVKITKGSHDNIKLTFPEDIIMAERILKIRGEVI